MRSIGLILICAGSVQADHVFTYTPRTMPAMWQSIIRSPETGTYFWPQFRHHGPDSEGFASNANMMSPWLRPAGCNNVEDLRIRRWISFPENGKIEIWTEDRSTGRLVVNGQVRNGLPHKKIRWRYPVGTRVQEKLYDGEKLFSTRERTKVSSDPKTPWKVTVNKHDHDPPGFQKVNRRCITCHESAGKHVSQLTDRHNLGDPKDFSGRDWYGYVRGDDQTFSFRPLRSDGSVQPFLLRENLVVDRRQRRRVQSAPPSD